MKTQHFLLAILLTFGLTHCTSNKEDVVEKTPESVLTAFAKMFPNATEVEWTLEDEEIWEADFTVDEASIEAEFSVDGTWLQTETELHKVDVPTMVTEAILAKYPKCEWREFEEVRSDRFLAYEVEIIYQGEEIEILITGSGEFLESEGGDDGEIEDAEKEEKEV